MNGRINIEEPDINIRFSMMEQVPVDDNVLSYREALNGNIVDTPLSIAYFSNKNMQILQNGIRAGVYHKSNGQYTIGIQSYDNLKIIMRGIYLQHSLNLPNNITEQIVSLNNRVLEYAINQIYGEAEGYERYARDVSTLVTPLPLPVMTKTNKTLELDIGIYKGTKIMNDKNNINAYF